MVVLIELRIRQQRSKPSRRIVMDGWLEALESFQDIGRNARRGRHQHGAGTNVPREDQYSARPKCKEEARRAKGPVALAQPQHVDTPKLRRQGVVLMRVIDTLGFAGRAARIIE